MYDPRNENSLSREVFAADQSIQGYIPDIRRNKREWFRYFDHNNDSKLSKPEILQALIDTMMTIYEDDMNNDQQGEVPDIDALSDMLDVMWSIAGLSPGDLIGCDQFLSHDGLADSIVGSLPPVPSSSASSSSASSSSTLQCAPAMQYLQMQCGMCGATKSIAYAPTIIATNMVVSCSVCGCRNDILLPRINSTTSANTNIQDIAPSSVASSSVPTNTQTEYPTPTTACIVNRTSNSSNYDGSSQLSFPSSLSTSIQKNQSLLFKHIFVLSPGRCGSQTFATACQHLSNYTAGHETNAHKYGEARLCYEDMHIECDNRLSWLLGHLGKKYHDDTTLYVILRRNEDEIAKSYQNRLLYSEFKASMIHAFANGIVMNPEVYITDEEQFAICKYYVETVYTNIEEFVRGRHFCTVHLKGDEGESFRQFLSMINAQGDLDGARIEFATNHDDKQCHPETKGGGTKVANVKV